MTSISESSPTAALGRSRELPPPGETQDFWIALIAGEAVWSDPDEPTTATERAASFLEIVSFVWCASMVWTGWYLDDEATYAYAITGTVAIIVLAARPTRMLLGRRRPSSFFVSFSVRMLMVIAIGVSGLITGPLFGFLVALSMSAALGIEGTLCAWTLGVSIEPVRWWWSFVRSPLHLGIIGAAIGSVISIGGEALAVVATVYAMLLSSIFGGILCASGLERFRHGVIDERTQAVEDAVGAEHRQSAHWLHDDVSSELKLVQLRLRAQPMSADDVAQELFDLDHRLRLRQLDELFASGTVNLAEILQPFVRRAQSQGLAITEVPTFDDASATVTPPLGRLFARAVSIVTNNAAMAGATCLAIRVSSDDVFVTVAVTDDAGGFDIDAVPAGRGLWQLRRELGTGDIDSTRTANGSTVTVRLSRKVRHVEDAAR